MFGVKSRKGFGKKEHTRAPHSTHPPTFMAFLYLVMQYVPTPYFGYLSNMFVLSVEVLCGHSPQAEPTPLLQRYFNTVQSEWARPLPAFAVSV